MDSYDYVMKQLGAKTGESMRDVLARTPLSMNRERNKAIRVLRSCADQAGEIQTRKIDKAARLLGANVVEETGRAG